MGLPFTPRVHCYIRQTAQAADDINCKAVFLLLHLPNIHMDFSNTCSFPLL